MARLAVNIICNCRFSCAFMILCELAHLLASDVTVANLGTTFLSEERAPKLCVALPRRLGSRSSAIFIYDVNKPLSGRITSAVAVRALPGRRCGAATERQSDRAAVVRYKSRTRAQIYDVAASLSLLAASCLYTLGRYGTLSLAMLYSWREWFIAGIFIFCLLHTHTHVHWLHEHCALSLRARERKRAAVSVSNICLRCC